jgi:mannosyltransferase
VAIDLLAPTRSAALAAKRTAPPGKPRGGPRQWARPAAVAAVHVLSFGIVLLGSRVMFSGKSLRLDEAQSLWQTNHSFGPLLDIVAGDVHVPLYHLVLRTWRLVLGTEIEAARQLSLIFLLASVPVFYLVARKLLSTPWALFAVVLFSCSPFLQWFGNEARMYSMLVLVTLVSQYFFLTLTAAGKARAAWFGYALAAVVGVHVHYFFVFVLVTQGLFMLALWGRLPRGTYLRLAAVAAVVVAGFTPWLLKFLDSGSGESMRPQLLEPSSVDYSNVYTQFLLGFQSDGKNTVALALWPLLVLAALASVRVGVRLERTTAYLIAAAFVPVLMAFAVSHLVAPIFLSRYMIAALPALLLLVVRFLSALSRPVARGLAVGLLGVTVLSTVAQAADPDTPVDEDYRAAVGLIEDGARPQDLVVLSSPFSVYPFEYYYDGAARVTTLPVWDRQGPMPAFDPAALPEDVDSFVQGHQYVYLLLSYDQGYEEEVFQYFERNFENTDSFNPSPGLRLLVYRVGYSDALPAGDD